jgi:hypothetical protein
VKRALLGLICISIVGWNSQASAQAANGVWRCKTATGNLPIGVLTITGANYRFVVASNSVWKPVPRDPANGSGRFASAANLAPMTGPLKTQYEIILGTQTTSGANTALHFSNSSGRFLTCWPQNRTG